MIRFRRKSASPAKTAPRRKKRLLSTDRMLALAGFGLAGLAAFLPWYAVIGGHGLGIRNDGLLRLAGHGESWTGHGVDGAATPFVRSDGGQLAANDFDQLSTGTIPEISETFRRAKAAAGAEDQPFPGRPFRVVHVANGQALIADGHGIYLVGVGSKLPDNSRLKTFEEKDGRWVIVTSNGDVIGP